MKVITSAQIRAARGLIRWSAETLAQHARLGVATVRRAEAAEGIPSITDANCAAIQAALEAGGVEFVPENGGGAGVRLREATAQIESVRIDRFNRRVSFHLLYRGRKLIVKMSTNILDDLDNTNYDSDKAFEEAFRRHQSKILQRAINAADTGPIDDDRSIQLDDV